VLDILKLILYYHEKDISIDTLQEFAKVIEKRLVEDNI
jgi:hypothetical protein